MSLERLAITCGGTGGHFFPGLSIAREVKSQGKEVLILLSGEHSASQKEIAEKFGITAVALPNMPNPRKAPFRFICGLIGGFFAALSQLRKFKPQALLGMGSFATSPLVAAAWWRRLPLFLHDGNARIGKANRVFSRSARVLGTGFPAVNYQNCRCRVVCTGMPVRPELRQFTGLSKADAIAELNAVFGVDFTADLPVILVTGGSQGAAIFNQVMPEVLCGRTEKFQLIHLTGKGKFEETAQGYQHAGFPKLLLDSCSQMELCLGAADLVFSRSGGSTAAELSLFGKVSVLVPYPYAAEGHQTDNAAYFESHGAAKMVANSEFTVAKVDSLLDDFFGNREKWAQMGTAMRELAVPDAAAKMVAEISAALD